jgi:hypothetical protein
MDAQFMLGGKVFIDDIVASDVYIFIPIERDGIESGSISFAPISSPKYIK